MSHEIQRSLSIIKHKSLKQIMNKVTEDIKKHLLLQESKERVTVTNLK